MFSAAAIRSGGHAQIHRFDDHPVFLNRCDPADPGVVGETFIVVGDDAVGGRIAQFLQREPAQVAIQDQIFAGLVFLGMHHERFNQAHFLERHENGLVAPDLAWLLD